MPLFQSNTAYSHDVIGNVLRATGKPAEAMNTYETALAIRQQLADANPTVVLYLSALAASHRHIGFLLSTTGKPTEALKAYEKSVSIYRKLADACPTLTGYQSDLAASLQVTAVTSQ